MGPHDLVFLGYKIITARSYCYLGKRRRHVVYTIKITNCYGDDWVVEWRYSDIRALFKTLRVSFGSECIPKCPSRKFIFRTRPKFVRRRMQDLEDFLQVVIDIDGITRHPSTRAFFDLNKNLQFALRRQNGSALSTESSDASVLKKAVNQSTLEKMMSIGKKSLGLSCTTADNGTVSTTSGDEVKVITPREALTLKNSLASCHRSLLTRIGRLCSPSDGATKQEGWRNDVHVAEISARPERAE
eukprot:GEMP01054599.1.p1 GENE.GEMP01054599.1~~GEMP01054599.1.p1  ORF type:complete len:243 (+),score=30.86 GEMP01054599.1:336-1064(+)